MSPVQTSRLPQGGIVPPLITPLLAPDKLDVAGLERLVEHVIEGGVHGIFILGTSGEAPNLDYRLRREVIERTVKFARHRVPVLVGITDTSFIEAVALGGFAADKGADALVTSAPYYFPVAQAELFDLVRRFARALPLPFYLYNMPQMTKVEFAPDTLRRAAQLEKVAGIKDSSGNLATWRQLVTVAGERPDWRLFVGPEELLVETMRLGGHGGVNGGGQVAPRLLVGLYEALRKGDEAAVTELQRQLTLLGRIYSVGPYGSSVVQGMKCALSLMGICSDLMTVPFSALAGRQRDRVRAVLEELGLKPKVRARKTGRGAKAGDLPREKAAASAGL